MGFGNLRHAFARAAFTLLTIPYIFGASAEVPREKDIHALEIFAKPPGDTPAASEYATKLKYSHKDAIAGPISPHDSANVVTSATGVLVGGPASGDNFELFGDSKTCYFSTTTNDRWLKTDSSVISYDNKIIVTLGTKFNEAYVISAKHPVYVQLMDEKENLIIAGNCDVNVKGQFVSNSCRPAEPTVVLVTAKQRLGVLARTREKIFKEIMGERRKKNEFKRNRKSSDNYYLDKIENFLKVEGMLKRMNNGRKYAQIVPAPP